MNEINAELDFGKYQLPEFPNLNYYNVPNMPNKKTIYSYKMLNVKYEATKKKDFELSKDEMISVAGELRALGNIGWKFSGVIEVLGYAALMFTQEVDSYIITSTTTTTS